MEGRKVGASEGLLEGDHNGKPVGAIVVRTAVLGTPVVGIIVGIRVAFTSRKTGPESVLLLIMTRSPARMPPMPCREATTEKISSPSQKAKATPANFKSVSFVR